MGLPAVILVGGEGTRLRPLTEHMPKPMLPLLDRPLLSYTFDHLRTARVDRAVLACGYLPTAIRRHYGKRYDGIGIDYRVEPAPLGTGGAIAFAAEGIESTFLALNGDSLREADLNALLAFHRSRNALATILLTRVPDPGRFGLVRINADGLVREFVEKPTPDQIDTDMINAGLYVLEPEVLDMIRPNSVVSLEREIFPLLAQAGALYALALPGYWLDVGTPASYLEAHFELQNRRGGVSVHPTAEVDDDVRLVAPVLIGARARVEGRTCLGPCVSVGTDATVGKRVVMRFSTVLPHADVQSELRVTRAIFGPDFGALSA